MISLYPKQAINKPFPQVTIMSLSLKNENSKIKKDRTESKLKIELPWKIKIYTERAKRENFHFLFFIVHTTKITFSCMIFAKY